MDCEQVRLLTGKVKCNGLKHIFPQVISWRQHTAFGLLDKRLEQELITSIVLKGVECKSRPLNELLDMLVIRVKPRRL